MSEEEENLTEAQQSLKKIQNFDTKNLERKNDLGGLAFTDAIDIAENIVSLSQKLAIKNVIDLPQGTQNNIKISCDKVVIAFNKMRNFSLTVPNPQNVRDQYINQLNTEYQNFFNALLLPVAYFQSEKNDFQKEYDDIVAQIDSIELKSNKTIDQVTSKANDAIARAETKISEAEELVEAIKNASAEGGTLEQAKFFGQEKTYHKKCAFRWSCATGGSAILLLAYTVFSIKLHTLFKIELTGADTQSLAIQVATTKMLIFAVLGYLLILSVRNFMSHKHNMVVNSHREVALHTFEALAKAANNDDGARDIILTHAASCIFGPQETGYSKSSSASEAGASLAGSSFILNMVKKPGE